MKIALGLLIAAICAHLYLFNAIPLQFDELLMYELISKLHTWQLIPFLYIEETQQPLGYLISKLFMTIDNSTFLMRLPTLVVTFLTPWAFYKLARLSMSREDAVKGGVFLILFYPILMYSGSMRPYVLFVFFTMVAFYQFLKPAQDPRKLYPALAALFFIHPLGSVLCFALTGNLILKKKNGLNLFLILTFIFLLFLTIGGLYRQEEIQQLFIKFSFNQYYRALYNFSFLISGREFFTFFLALVFTLGVGAYRKKSFKFPLEEIWLHSFGWSILSAIILMALFGKHVYPRHFMFLLPGLALLLVRMINAATDKIWLRHGLFILGCLILSYKSLVKEKLHDVPFEIASADIAANARQMARGNLPIASCGNCFSFYLKNDLHLCSGAAIPKGYFSSLNEAIYVELNYVKDKCGLSMISEPYRIQESRSFKGAVIHHLVFQNPN